MNELRINPEIFNILVEDHKAKFPNSHTNIACTDLSPHIAYFSSTIFSPESWIDECNHSDPMRVIIQIKQVDEDDYIASVVLGKYLTILPTPEDKAKQLFYSEVECPFRKITGNAEKIIKSVKTWQEKRLALVKEYKTEIPRIESSNLKDI